MDWSTILTIAAWIFFIVFRNRESNGHPAITSWVDAKSDQRAQRPGDPGWYALTAMTALAGQTMLYLSAGIEALAALLIGLASLETAVRALYLFVRVNSGADAKKEKIRIHIRAVGSHWRSNWSWPPISCARR